MTKKKGLVLGFFVLFIFFLNKGCQKQGSAWKGTISQENGVTVVKNPKEPLYTSDVFSLEEELTITDEAGGEDVIFNQIRSMDVDEVGRIYVLDYREARVYIFDEDGTFIKSFGKKGQGPGEMNRAMSMKITPQKELAIENSGIGINFYSLEGDFIRELKTAKEAPRMVSIDSRGHIFGIVIVRDEENPRYEVRKFDPQMNRIASFDSSPLPTARGQGINPFGGLVVFFLRYDDYVVSASPETYELHVFDPEGDLVMKITKDYDPVAITKEEKEEVMEGFPDEIPVSIPKYHNPFGWFVTDDEGRIFVRTYEKVGDGNGFFYDVFDIEGKFLVKIPLKTTPYLLKNKKLYTVEEDEQGFQCVKRYRVIWKY
jgi:hypothetical protein